MKNSNIMKIINEEISNFNFLENDDADNEHEIIEFLENEDFQKQFICDSLLNKKIKIIDIDAEINSVDKENLNNTSKLYVEYIIKLEIDFEKNPINFELNFNGNVTINNNSFDWNNINVSLFTNDGDNIEFKSFKNAPNNIKILFIKKYLEDYIKRYVES